MGKGAPRSRARRGSRRRELREGRTGGRAYSTAFYPVAALRSLLAQIGTPSQAPFRPDPFQEEAVARVAQGDLLVCAPTGAGKTWIALEAMARGLERGQQSWYASPLKALSNAKYEELRARFGPERVGILTGDRKENHEAHLIEGTTEILRKQLYDAMDRGADLAVDLVILDEAHYLSDPDRGVVWEEVLIYLPVRVRLLLLSATVGNPEEVCRWLTEIRGQPCRLVQSLDRPVPLHALFADAEGRLGPLLGRRGLQPMVLRYLQRQDGRRRGDSPRWDLEGVVEGLRGLDLLPAIFFLKSRSDCDRAVDTFGRFPRSPASQEETWAAAEPLLRDFPVLRGHRQFRALLGHGVASHHAGQLPQWKRLVEHLMNGGQLDAIFSTSTVAAGVDFPARTVVVPQSDRYNGRDFEPLSATEIQQMIGRAGRRGKDRVGFALFLPGPHQDLSLVARLLRAGPDGLRSRIQINFSMVLNLLLSHRPQEIRPLLRRSLAAAQWRWGGAEAFQSARRTGGERGQLRRMGRSGARAGTPALLLRRLERGRTFVHRDGSVHLVFRLAERRGKPLCLAHRLDRDLRIRKGRVVLRGIRVADIRALLELRVELPDEDDVDGVRRALAGADVQGVLDSALGGGLPEIRDRGAGRMGGGGGLVGDAGDDEWLWRDFLAHVAFLRETGFADVEERLTPDGRWASQLRLDHPVLVAEAIRRGVFHGRSAPVLAGMIAPFVTDREREVVLGGEGLEEIGDAFDALLTGTYQMGRMLAAAGFAAPVLQFWPAAALYLWATGVSWRGLRSAVAMDEGDLVSLIVRTGDHLRQVCDLEKTHPLLARTARMALRRIEREPAVYL